MGNLTIKLFGPPQVRHEGRSVEFRARKSLALLAYLAAGDGSRSRDEITNLLWPRSDGERGRASLRSALAGLRGALGEATAPPGRGHLVVDGDALGLASGPELDLDLGALESAHALARSVPGSRDLAAELHHETVSRLRSAAEAYRGEFLKGFYLNDAPDFDLWLDLQREAWRGRLELVYDRLSGLLLEAGELGEAITTAAAWTERLPLSEEAHRRLMEVQLAAGDGPGALNTYETFRSLSKRELGAEPRPEIEALASRAGERASVHAPQRGHMGAPRAVTRAGNTPELPSTPFVGRSEEFDALADAYRFALSGDSQVVALVGDAGIGKTRLAEEFLSWAEAQGADVLRGRPPQSGGLAFGVLTDALRRRVERERAPDDLVDDVWLSELARILPELKERYPDLQPPSGEESQARARLLEAISRLVAAFDSREAAPVILFLDDMHWASRSSLDALRYAGRRWVEEGTRVLVIFALRPEATEALPSLAGWLSGLARELPVRYLELEPLALGDTLNLLRALLGRTSGGEDREEGGPDAGEEPSGVDLERLGLWLYEETGGQPLFLSETLKLLLAKGVLIVRTEADGTPVVSLGSAARDVEALRGSLPENVREAIHARLSRLSGGAQKLLAAGAVLVPRFTFERAVKVTGLEENEGLEALDEALASRLVEEGRGEREPFGSGDVYVFAHEKVRDVIYTEAGAARRRVFHRRTFETLESAGGIPSVELARHALAAGLPDQAFRHSIAAGDAAMALFAAGDAIVHYERARRLIGDGTLPATATATAPELERLHTKLGRAYEFSEDWEEARKVYEALLSYARKAREPALEWAALNHMATLAMKRSYDLDTAKRLFEDALQVAERTDDRVGIANVEWSLAETLARASDPDAALEHGERALALARELGLTELAAGSLYALASRHAHIGDWKSAAANAEESRKLYAEIREKGSSDEGPALVSLRIEAPPSSALGYRAMEGENLSLRSLSMSMLGLHREGVEAGRGALAIGVETSNTWLRANASVGLAMGLTDSGEYEEALHVARRGVDEARVGASPFIPMMLVALGYAYEAVLLVDAAREAHQEALERSETIGNLFTLVSTSYLCANRALAGDWETAHAYALELAALMQEVRTPVRHTNRACHLHTEAFLRGGDERLAREGVRRVGRSVGDNRRNQVSYLRSLAVLARWEGDADAAVERLREAALLAEDLGLPGQLWQIRADLGELYEEQGEDGEARRAFAETAQVVQALAEKIGEEGLRSSFLAASRVRRVLAAVQVS